MTETQWVVIIFWALMCVMSLAASYFEAKDKKSTQTKDIDL